MENYFLKTLQENIYKEIGNKSPILEFTQDQAKSLENNLKKNIKNFLTSNNLNFLEVKVSNSKIKKLPRPTDLIKIKNLFKLLWLEV